jgi:tetratricopeptide (TPR) repeat protein
MFFINKISRFAMKKFLALLIILFLFPSPVYADTIPPNQAPGANLIPSNANTYVAIEREYVTIKPRPKAANGDLEQADVDVFYTMMNHGFMDEYMTVRMPLTSLEAQNNNNTALPEITDVSVTVATSPVTVRRVMWGQAGQPDTPWAEFSMVFPLMKEIDVEVKYTLNGVGVYPFVSYKYILSVGTAWWGKVTRLNVQVYLPYEADYQNTFQGEDMGWLSTTPFGYLRDQEMYWNYLNLIFDKGSYVQASFVVPAVWQTVLKERANVDKTATDGQAWKRLADLYKSILLLPQGMRSDPGGLGLYPLSLEAYRKAISLLPNDADNYSNYADLLYNHYYGMQASGVQPDRSEITLSLQALQHALEIDPNNQKASAVLGEIQKTLPGAVEAQGGKYNFLWLSATPTINASLVTQSPTATTTLTPTSAAAGTSHPTASSNQRTPSNSVPLCGGFALIPVFIAGFVRLRRANRTAKVN